MRFNSICAIALSYTKALTPKTVEAWLKKHRMELITVAALRLATFVVDLAQTRVDGLAQ
jgi:hypothetical protein